MSRFPCCDRSFGLKIISVLMFIVALMNFRLVDHSSPQHSNFLPNKRMPIANDPTAVATGRKLHVPTPILVVGLPKAGTTSIFRFFQCSGVQASHYCCCGVNRSHTHCNEREGGKTMAKCMMDNIKQERPILDPSQCGHYDVYAQMDAEHGKSIFLPQHFQLQRLYNYSPNATWILNTRPAMDWVNSVSNWYGMGGRFLTKFGISHKNISRHEVLANIFNNHTSTIKDFVKQHPSLRMVEVDISNPEAGSIMSRTFGLPEDCWSHHNKNKKIKHD